MAKPEIVLHQFAPVMGVASGSPFCLKVHAALRLKGLDYRVVDLFLPPQVKKVNKRMKLPVLSYNGKMIPDSTDILAFLETTHPNPALVPADPAQRALVRLLEDWADESLYWYGVWVRWVQAEGAAKLPEMFFRHLPGPLRKLAAAPARLMVTRQIKAQGLARKPDADILRDFELLLDTLDTMLGGRDWLVGDSASWADIGVSSMLYGLTIREWRPDIAEMIARRKNVNRWLGSTRGWYEKR